MILDVAELLNDSKPGDPRFMSSKANDLEKLYFEPVDFFSEHIPSELANGLCTSANIRIKKAIDAFHAEVDRGKACQMNYSEALGEIRGMKFAYQKAMDMLMRANERDD